MAVPHRQKQIHLNFFDICCTGSHMAIGNWKDPNCNSRRKDTLDYYIWMAKLAEKGKITSIFFADTYAVHETYKGKADGTFRGGQGVAQLDPVVMISAMAAATESVSFGVTGSTTYIHPYLLARTWGTLDHMTGGRVAWNVVTSYNNTAAKAMGGDKVTPHDKRYTEAAEYMDMMYAFWEGSWEDDAAMWSPTEGAYDPDKVHRIKYNGEFRKTSAYCQVHPGPQRTPFIFQAGQSRAGKAFAAKHAEAIFMSGSSAEEIAPVVKEIRAAAVAAGRDPYDVKMIPSITPILGKTLEEAEAKLKRAEEYADWEGGLATLSGWTGCDLSKYPLDEPFNFDGIYFDNTVHSMVEATQNKMNKKLTPRELGKMWAFGGFGEKCVGTPEMVADMIQKWIDVGDIDGFNLAYMSNPESFEDIVEMLVPVLQKRGMMWEDYSVPGGTFRENMRREPGQKHLVPSHPGAQFKYNILKEKYADEEGDIVIDKMVKENGHIPVAPAS